MGKFFSDINVNLLSLFLLISGWWWMGDSSGRFWSESFRTWRKVFWKKSYFSLLDMSHFVSHSKFHFPLRCLELWNCYVGMSRLSKMNEKPNWCLIRFFLIKKIGNFFWSTTTLLPMLWCKRSAWTFRERKSLEPSRRLSSFYLWSDDWMLGKMIQY